ncbi:MAG: hypothetical protein K0R65_481 [Crocinitomicaceae bacterium]|jgi:hypothetical protein|nr:hypothetical protein [Crocinitomicaceae bacterium]
MGKYSEIEKLFQDVLDEKDRFKIFAEAEEICKKLKETEFKEECSDEKEDCIDKTHNLLSIYSITFNEIMREKIRQQKDKVLKCIDAKDN